MTDEGARAGVAGRALCGSISRGEGRLSQTPTTILLNRLLWADWKGRATNTGHDKSENDSANDRDINDQEDVGLIVRASDFLSSSCEATHKMKASDSHYLPASFLHASLRAPNAIFVKESFPGTGRVFGTRYVRNCRSLRRYQRAVETSMPVVERNGHENSVAAHAVVRSATYFPGDGGTMMRGSTKHINGTGCRPAQRSREWARICLNDGNGTMTCAVNVEKNCQCDASAVPPDHLGQHATRVTETMGWKYGGFTHTMCWYPGESVGYEDDVCTAGSSLSHNPSNLGIANLTMASNSFWLQRKGWLEGHRGANDGWDDRIPFYTGHTEAMATKAVLDVDVADAIFIKVPKTMPANLSLCDCSPSQLDQIMIGVQKERALECSPNRLHSILPVVFYAETLGMADADECARVWDGTNCSDGYRKEFFSQRVNFSDGSCLASPPGCEDVYYYPRDPLSGICFAYVQRNGTSPDAVHVDDGCPRESIVWSVLEKESTTQRVVDAFIALPQNVFVAKARAITVLLWGLVIFRSKRRKNSN